MKNNFKNILRIMTPRPLKRLYKSLRINPDDYILLPKKDITYATDQLYTFHNADFMKEKRFAEAYALAKKVDDKHCLGKNDIPWRMHVLYWAGTIAKNIPGDFIDCGVNTGFCARSLIQYIDFNKTGKKYYLLDTFAGLDPKYSSEKELEIHKTMKYNQKDLYETVTNTFKNLNVEIIKGSVPDTLSKVKTETVAFLHLDMNSAIPEVSALDFFWNKISKGGIVLFDDYAYEGNHIMKATHDVWAKSHGVEILSLPTAQGLLIKQ